MSQFHEFLNTITWWGDPQTGDMSMEERADIAKEAARWFETRPEAGLLQRIHFRFWLYRSRHHLIAFQDQVRIDAYLKTCMYATPSLPPVSAAPRSEVSKSSGANIAAGIIVTACVVGAFSYYFQVLPVNQQLELLATKIARLQSQLAAIEASQTSPGTEVRIGPPHDPKPPLDQPHR